MRAGHEQQQQKEYSVSYYQCVHSSVVQISERTIPLYIRQHKFKTSNKAYFSFTVLNLLKYAWLTSQNDIFIEVGKVAGSKGTWNEQHSKLNENVNLF